MYQGYYIVDADGHVIEPVDLWVTRLPEQFRDRAPQPAKPRGYTFKDQVYPRNMAQVILEANEEKSAQNYQSSIQAQWSAESQVVEMDKMGLDVSYLYPTRGLGMWFFRDMEPDLATACARTYNDWLHEFTQVAPDRLKPVGGVALQDPLGAVDEVKRIHELGMRSIFLRPNPVDGRMLSDPAYEPLWAALEERDMSVGIHEGSQANVPHLGEDRLTTHFATHTSHALEQMMAFLTLLEGGVLERHPTLRFAFLESGCGWVPYWLWRLDEVEYKSSYVEVKDFITMRPSEYFKRQCFVSAEPEPFLGAVVDYVGADSILFGSDFPHPDHGPEIMDEMVELEAVVGEAALRKILKDNPNRFYGEG